MEEPIKNNKGTIDKLGNKWMGLSVGARATVLIVACFCTVSTFPFPSLAVGCITVGWYVSRLDK